MYVVLEEDNMRAPDRFERAVVQAFNRAPPQEDVSVTVAKLLRREHAAVRSLLQKLMRKERRVDWAEDSFREVYLHACQDILAALDKRRKA
jgi:hypothetical protein